MSPVLSAKWGEIRLKMNGYDTLYTPVMCSDQFLASKIHSILNVRNQITAKTNPSWFLSSYIGKKLHHHLIRLQIWCMNLLSDWSGHLYSRGPTPNIHIIECRATYMCNFMALEDSLYIEVGVSIGKGSIVYHNWSSWRQCSRLKPSYEFHVEGFSNFNPSVEGLVQIQDINPRI